jgi:hypothetical protein
MRILKICILIFYCLCTACQQNKGGSVKLGKKKSATADVKFDYNSNAVNEPKINLALPFGVNAGLSNFLKSERYFISFIYKNIEKDDDRMLRLPTGHQLKQNAYDLPIIKSFKYQSLSDIVPDSCLDKTAFSSHLKLTKYRYRLPDINGYECYYWCDYHDVNKSDYPDKVRVNCKWCITSEFYGYLIFYDRKTAAASVLLVYFDIQLEDLFYFRFFIIGNDYQIKLIDFSMNGEDGLVPVESPSVQTVTLTKNGDFVIKK